MSLDGYRGEERFVVLRRRLDAMGYREPLGVESFSLAAHLLDDLVRTTESYKNLSGNIEALKAENEELSLHVHPLRRENGRLMKENNALHLDSIRRAEESSTALRDEAAAKKQALKERDEVIFVNHQLQQKIRKLERTATKLRRKLDEIAENRVAFGRDPRDEAPAIAIARMPRLDIAYPLPGADRDVHSLRSDGSTYPASSVEMVRMAESAARRSENELASVRQDRDRLIGVAKTLRATCEARDAEIVRLGKLLERGRDVKSLSIEHLHSTNERIIEQLSAQVNMLNEQVQVLEGRKKTKKKKLARSAGGGDAKPGEESYSAAIASLKRENEVLTGCVEDLMLKNKLLSAELEDLRITQSHQVLASEPLNPHDARLALDAATAAAIRHGAGLHRGVTNVF